MKKILSILLAVVMMATLFYGCNKDNADNNSENQGESDKIEIISRTLDVVLYDDGTLTDYWNEVIAAFEASNAGVTVNATIGKNAAYELRDMILGGSSPDFVYLPSSEESGITEALIKDKAMRSLDDVAEAVSGTVLSGVFDNAFCKTQDDDSVYLAPLFFEQEGLIYNKKLLRENSWSVPTTWDEFISIAQACDDKDFAVFTYAGREPDEFVNMFVAAVAPVVGTEQVNKLLECDKDAWTDNEQVKAFAEKLDAIKKLVVSGSSTKSKEDALESFKNGEALFVSGSVSELKELLEDENAEYGFALYPALSGDAVAVATVEEMYIPIEAKNVDLAKDFMKFLYSSDAAVIAAQTAGKIPPVATVSDIAAQYELESAEKEAYSAVLNSLLASKFEVKASDNETLSDEFCALAVSVFKGDVEPDEFAAKMVEYIEEY